MNALRQALASPRSMVRAITQGKPPATAVVGVVPTPDPPATPVPPTEPVLGVCLSGGGSRALSAALGALSGLRSIQHPHDSTRTVMDDVKHLSSVSGGSWASVAYTFLPHEVDGRPIDDDEFLIAPIPPHKLVKAGDAEQPENVEYMNPRGLGTAPQRFSPLSIGRVLFTFWRWGMFSNRAKLRWFWIAGVGELILKPFDLYDGRYPRTSEVTQPARFFAQSQDEFDQHIRHDNPALRADRFHFVERERPALVVNFNLLEDLAVPDPVQVPIQATPSITGILGQSPDRDDIGGGSVQSFGFGTTLAGRGPRAETARVDMERRYSLADIAGCSSAFFAAAILSHLDDGLHDIEQAIIERLRELHVPRFVGRALARFLCSRVEPILNESAEALIPQYPYWAIDELDSTSPQTMSRGFTDGGSFEDTGVLGMLARTDANRIIAFVNGAAPLTKDEQTNEIKIDEQLGDPALGAVRIEGQISTLFGYTWDDEKSQYRKYTDREERRFAQVFSDEGDAFDEVRSGLWEASAAGGEVGGTATAAYLQQLTTIDNRVAEIQGGREVTVLWVLNNRVNAWQDEITDPGIRDDLARGQAGQNPDGSPKKGSKGSGPLDNFPLYTTAGQIHLDEEAVNMLAQLSAWNVQQLQPSIARLLAVPVPPA